MNQTIPILIPGTVTASYDTEDGSITRIVFTPHASNAGYFGPSAIAYDDNDLDLESTDGLFWRAVQSNLTVSGGLIGWEE